MAEKERFRDIKKKGCSSVQLILKRNYMPKNFLGHSWLKKRKRYWIEIARERELKGWQVY